MKVDNIVSRVWDLIYVTFNSSFIPLSTLYLPRYPNDSVTDISLPPRCLLVPPSLVLLVSLSNLYDHLYLLSKESSYKTS